MRSSVIISENMLGEDAWSISSRVHLRILYRSFSHLRWSWGVLIAWIACFLTSIQDVFAKSSDPLTSHQRQLIAVFSLSLSLLMSYLSEEPLFLSG